jgi:hypothetical protein
VQLEALEFRPVHEQAEAVREAEPRIHRVSDIRLGEEGLGVGVAVDRSSVDQPDEDDDLPLAPVPDPCQGGTGAFGAAPQVDLNIL